MTDPVRRTLQGFLVPVLAGLVLAVLAPLGTAGFAFIWRLAYWVGLSLAGSLGAMAANALLVRRRSEAGFVLRVAVQALGATVAVAPFVIGLFGISGLAGLALTLFYVAMISAVIATVGELAGERTQNARPPDAPAARPPLMDRLPLGLREATLHAIASEDHYVRVYTDRGEHMLLMRLGDAEDLAAPVDGVKPHRSWWVAKDGVDRIEREGGKRSIRLRSGLAVPVSRSGAKALREAGWF